MTPFCIEINMYNFIFFTKKERFFRTHSREVKHKTKKLSFVTLLQLITRKCMHVMIR